MNRKLRKILGLLSICILFSLNSFSQDSKQRHEQIEAVKVAFITNKLDLTAEEAQKFWPVYNSYQAEWMNLMRKRKDARTKKNIDPDDKISADLEYESKMLALKKKYRALYSKVIPSQKILLLYQAEREFREHLIKQLNHRKRSDS